MKAQKQFSVAAVEAAMEAQRIESGRWCIMYDEASKKYMIGRRVQIGECDCEIISRLGIFPSDLGECRDVFRVERDKEAMRAALEAAEVE